MLALHHSAGKPEDKSEVRSLKYERLTYFRLQTSYLFVFSILCPSLAHAQPRLTFTRDIAPIVWSRCASSHRPAEIGPFSLITYDEVRRHAAQIAEVTALRIMPPSKPVEGKRELQSERRLTDAELRLLQQWIAAGAPEGDPSALPRPPAAVDGWQLGTPDLVVRMAEEYAVPAGGTDAVRTFLIPIPVAPAPYVRHLDVHHGN